jgi:hypothetical protein
MCGRPFRFATSIAALAWLAASAAAADSIALPFAPGERVVMRISYARLLAGRATVSVQAAEHDGRRVHQLVAEARSQGFFAWLFRFRVNDRTVASWDPASGCSLGIEKHLREGRAVRDQVVRFDPVAGVAQVQDPKIAQTRFEVDPCALDVLSAFYVTRVRGVSEDSGLELPVFDNGKRYRLAVRFRGRERLDLPAPLGKRVPTVVVEPMLMEGTGLFVKEKDARLRIWLTDDARRIPVRMRSKVAIGWVSADLESYEPGVPAPAREGP